MRFTKNIQILLMIAMCIATNCHYCKSKINIENVNFKIANIFLNLCILMLINILGYNLTDKNNFPIWLGICRHWQSMIKTKPWPLKIHSGTQLFTNNFLSLSLGKTPTFRKNFQNTKVSLFNLEAMLPRKNFRQLFS